MKNILIVCTANICRSPVAAALLEDRLNKRGLSDWKVRSVGTWAMFPRGASRYSIEVARKQGLDLSKHLATMVDENHLRLADLVLTMEIGHAEALRAEFPENEHKIFLISEMVGHSYNIADPYGGPYEGYEQMMESLTEVIDEGLDRIVELAEGSADGRA